MHGIAGLLGWSWIFVSGKKNIIGLKFRYLYLDPGGYRYGRCRGRCSHWFVFFPLSLIQLNIFIYGYRLIIVLVNFPSEAKFLTPEERAFVIWKKSRGPCASLPYPPLTSLFVQNTIIQVWVKKRSSHLGMSGPLLKIGK